MQLLDTKSLDRKQTLLHYIVHVVEMIYPNVLSFYEDLYIEEACTGVYVCRLSNYLHKTTAITIDL